MGALLQVTGVAALWFVLFHVNDWAFGYFDAVAHVINWVFLPAALRLLSVMLLGWRATVGLFLGTLATNGATFGDSAAESLVVAAISGVGPLLAVHLTMRILQVPLTLHGLTPRRLAVFALVGALCNVVPCNLFFWAIGLITSPYSGVVPMFVGDLFGILIVLYTLRAILVLTERHLRS